MKKLLSLFIVVLSIFSIQFCYAATGTVITNVQGDAKIIRGGQEMVVTNGMECKMGDHVVTSPTCKADFSVNGVAGCRVLEGSDIEIADDNLASMNVKINKGNAILNLEKLKEGSTFRVETPTAIAAVRGTQFWGRVVSGDQGVNPVTTFAVREGAVQIFAKSANKNYLVEKGQALDIAETTDIVPVIRPALEAELAALEQAESVKTSA